MSRYIKPSGKYFLDVGSGPITHREYLSFSNGVDIRICVDLSFSALMQAKKKLGDIGDKGIYILADITTLPIGDNLADAAVSIHTIYHVPTDEQSKAFHELYRVLKPGSSAVVIYSWGPTLLINAKTITARKIRDMINKGNKSGEEESSEYHADELNFYSHNYKWFTSQEWGFEFNILPWRTASTLFLKTCVHNWLFGKQLLAFLYWLEENSLIFLCDLDSTLCLLLRNDAFAPE